MLVASYAVAALHLHSTSVSLATPIKQVVIYSSSTSNVVEFDMPAYPDLYLSFLIYYPKP